MWEEVRKHKLNGAKFYRQYPIYYDINGKESFFIADFYNHKNKLVIELEGTIHKYRLRQDRERTEILNFLGIKVLRFLNIEIEQNLELVLNKIRDSLKIQ